MPWYSCLRARLWCWSKWVWIPVTLLRSLSGKGMNSLTFQIWVPYYPYHFFTRIALALYNPGKLICHEPKKPKQSVNVKVCVSTGIVFQIELCLLHRSLPSGRCGRNFRPEHQLARIRSFSNWPACETDAFLGGSRARQKEVSTWILLNWFDLNHHFRGVFPFLEQLRVNLFCFSFQVGECVVGECKLVFTLNTCAIKIYIFISTRLVSLVFGPSCCC